MSSKLNREERNRLLALARASIRDRLVSDGSLTNSLAETALTAPLREPGASFITLKKAEDGDATPRLRGCVGNVASTAPLYRNVIENAARSAFEDPRFPPLSADELNRVRIEISVLTPLRPIEDPSAIVIGRDGVQLEKQGAGALFLPQVAVQFGWDVPRMLEQLSGKAGLPRDGWRGATLSVFGTESFGEEQETDFG